MADPVDAGGPAPPRVPATARSWRRLPERRDDGPVIAAFSITPLGTGESVGELVAEAVRIVRASGLRAETNAMFTNVEGEWDEVMGVIRTCVERLGERSPRLSVVIKLDVRRDAGSGELERKVESVERRLA